MGGACGGAHVSSNPLSNKKTASKMAAAADTSTSSSMAAARSASGAAATMPSVPTSTSASDTPSISNVGVANSSTPESSLSRRAVPSPKKICESLTNPDSSLISACSYAWYRPHHVIAWMDEVQSRPWYGKPASSITPS